jgi:hypothetical protein
MHHPLALQDEGVAEQKSCQSHSQTHGFLVLIWRKAALQQLRFHLIEHPASRK